MTAIVIALSLIAFAILIVATAVFVAAEFSLVTVDRALVEERVGAGDTRVLPVQAGLRALSFQLSVSQFGITVTALLTGFLAEPAIAQLLRPVLADAPLVASVSGPLAIALALVLATLASMLFGELIPKNAALAKPLEVAIIAAPLQRWFSMGFAIVIRALNANANAIVRRLGVEPQEELASARSAEELGLLASISAQAGTLPAGTAALVQRTIRFAETRAAEAMTPRVDLVALDTDATAADLLELARASGHSRFPVYQDTLDQIVGVASVTEALAVPPQRRHSTLIREVAHEPVVVPGTLDLDSVLDRLREAGTDVAVVIDEYGGTDGIVTTEDLAEELVGEIDDEYDPPQVEYDPAGSEGRAERSVLLSGVLHDGELAEQTTFVLPEGPYETLAGFLIARLGHIPVPGEAVVEDGWRFVVEMVEKHRVEFVRAYPPADWEPPAEMAVMIDPPVGADTLGIPPPDDPAAVAPGVPVVRESS